MSVVSLPSSAVSRIRDDRRVRTCRDLLRALSAPEEERQRIRQNVVLDHLDVAEAVAHRYRSPYGDAHDLQQVAYMGLTKAVSRFQPDRGNDIVSFAVPTISGEIKRYLRDTSWSVRPPRELQERSLEVTRQLADLSQSLGREPSISELADEAGMTREQVVESLGCLQGRRPSSLDAPVRDDRGAALGDTIATDDDGYAQVELRTALAAACRDLPARDRRVLRMRFIDEMTQAQIAGEIGVTQMQVSRILARVLRTLRARLSPDLLAA